MQADLYNGSKMAVVDVVVVVTRVKFSKGVDPLLHKSPKTFPERQTMFPVLKHSYV